MSANGHASYCPKAAGVTSKERALHSHKHSAGRLSEAPKNAQTGECICPRNSLARHLRKLREAQEKTAQEREG